MNEMKAVCKWNLRKRYAMKLTGVICITILCVIGKNFQISRNCENKR